MTRQFLLFIFLFSSVLSARAQYYLEHINVIDVENGKISTDQSVFIESNLIKSISSQPNEDPRVQAYDCTGKYLMPGLWDMHIHDGNDSLTRYKYIPLFLVNGVTGIRDMWGSEEMLKLKSGIDAGRFMGPRFIVGSPIIDGEKPFFRSSLAART